MGLQLPHQDTHFGQIPMKDEQEILKKIFELTAGALEGKSTRERPSVQQLQAFSWLRITRLSSFWQQGKPTDTVIPLDSYITDMISGLYGIGCPWGYLLFGYPDRIECWFGAQTALLGEDGLRQCLRGALPDVRFLKSEKGKPSPTPDFSILSSLPVGCSFSGTPTLKRDTETREPRADQIEKVCRTLYGSTWAYLIVAQKYEQTKTLQDINAITLEIQNIHATYMLKQSAVDENNKTAERYIELLEKRLERWETGRITGMWNYKGWLMASDPSKMRRGSAILHSAFSGKDSLPDHFRVHPISPEGIQPVISAPLNSSEIACMACPPLEECSGLEVIPPVRFGVETNQNFQPGADLVHIGAILDRGDPVGRDLSIKRSDLTKHGIIVGVTGAGKTNTCFSLLEQVWKEGKGVPFMVIESAKSEYRALLKNPKFKGLRVFTVGDETISPIRLNPFQVPKGILIQSHIDYLQALFGAAFVLYPPMPYVLSMSIQRVYEEKGWDLTRNINTRGDDSPSCFPTLDDLIITISKVSDGMGYEGEIRSNIKAGLEGRLNQLRIGGGKGVMLNCRESLSDEDLFGAPCILELKQLVSDEEKAFLIGLLLIRLYEHYESSSHSGDGTLKHVTLIEEAHRLLKNVSTAQGGDSANPQGKAIEVFANMLAEIRAFGEGMFMAEQIPTKLAPEALKNTNLKLIHRLVAKDDREAVGATMNLSEEQLVSLTTLRPGQAVTYLEGMEKPVLLQIPETETKKNYEQITPAEIREKMQPFWKERGNLLRPHAGCGACTCTGESGGCGKRVAPNNNKLLFDSAEALVQGFRWEPFRFMRFREEFATLFSQLQPYGKGIGSDYCFLVSYLVREVSSRAELSQISHKEADSLVQVTSALLLPGIKDPQSQAEKVSRLWQKSQACDSKSFPFPGCSYCRKPCDFRYDVNERLNAENLEIIAELGWDEKKVAPKTKELAKVCIFENAPHAVIADWAFCCAVQVASRQELHLQKQNEFAQALANTLFVEEGTP